MFKPAAFMTIAAVLLVGCGEDAKPTEPAANALKPEMVVKPVKGQFLAGCRTEALLNELLMHSAQREKTKFEAMFRNLDCTPIPEDGTFKLLAVRAAVVEFTAASSQQSNGMWTVVEAFLPSQ